MNVTLPEELARVLDEQGNTPLPTVHPSTGKVFFLVSEEQYQWLKPILEKEPPSLDEQRFQLEQMGKRAGWDDPAMDAYDRYDEHRDQGSL